MRGSRDDEWLGRLEQIEHALGDGEPVRAGVELRAEPAQRLVQLGREHEHGQPRLQTRARPSTSRTPTVTAASATPSVAASSSTEPERKLTRSVAIVACR